MHIALGVRTDQFPIDSFLGVPGKTAAAISAAADQDHKKTGQLEFSGNPNRRGGEWRIADQYSNRHPAWSLASKFPDGYNPDNPPYILIFKINKLFYARFCMARQIARMDTSAAPKGILVRNTGIAAAPAVFSDLMRVPNLHRLDEFEIQLETQAEEQFNPKDIFDGRRRIISSVVRRLGQQTFRRKLLKAYDGQCAMTKCRTHWVLEAAHIVPYRGIKTNVVSNGLLLRADLHTLFDLALIAIEPAKIEIKVSTLLAGSKYEALDGRSPVFPTKTALHPNLAALEYHYTLFRP